MKLPNLGTRLLTSLAGYPAVVCDPLACLPEAFGNVSCHLLRLLGAHYLAHASLVSAFVNRGALRAQVCKVPRSQLLQKPRPELLLVTNVTYMSLCFVCELLKPPIGVMKVLTTLYSCTPELRA